MTPKQTITTTTTEGDGKSLTQIVSNVSSIPVSTMTQPVKSEIGGTSDTDLFGPKSPKPRVYVAGPYSGKNPHDVQCNVDDALFVANDLWHAGYHPMVPHLTHYWEQKHPHDYMDWLELDLAWLYVADCMYVIEESPGVRIEMEFCRRHDIPIFFNLSDMNKWRDEWLTQQKTVWVDEKPIGDPRFHAVLAELGHLHDKKQQDYGSPTDPFANFRSGEDWGIPAWVHALLRAQEKNNRLKSLHRNGRLENEPARDSFLDLAVCAIIGLVLWEESQQK